MFTLQISLPDDTIEMLRARTAEAGYNDVSEYIQELVLADQDRKSWDDLEKLVLEGVQSGPPQPLTDADWDAIRAEVAARNLG